MTPVYKFYITANSPGEISGFVSPVIKRLKKRFPACIITVILLPCTFSTGTEEEVLKSIKEVDRVIPPGKFINFRKNLSPEKKGAILHFGGDLFYASLLSRKIKLPTFAYIWAKKSWDRDITAYFVKNEKDVKRLMSQGIDKEKIIIIGDLVADEVSDTLLEIPCREKRGKGIRICYMPGSRPREIRGLLPFLLQVAVMLKEKFPDSEHYLMISPFIRDKDLETVLSNIIPHPKAKGLAGSYNPETEEVTGESGKGLKLVRSGQKEIMAGADLIITIPGTKTAEAGVLGIPGIVFLPLNEPSVIPHVGLVGLLDYIPFIGPYIKGRILLRLSDKFGFMAQPNLLAGEEIIPEIRGIIYPEEIANRAIKLLESPDIRKNISKKLLKIYNPFKGSADRLVNKLGEYLEAEKQ
ncbi:MAG: hypothetical protein J7M18_05530 [Candidatus Eremiobacteraeota bacterium]|nr:hypothetical protein [Candidatus Eremiobacteraeota bacterium]